MKLAFISTILGYPWGGADTLWTHAAEAARDRGDRLFVSVSSAVAAHPRVRGLGAEILARQQPGATPSFATRVRRKLGLARPADAQLIAALHAFNPDLVCFSHGGTYDLILHQPLTAWLHRSHIPYRLVANWQEEQPHLAAGDLAFIREAFPAANRLFFVSTRNLAATRRHLALPLPNAAVIQNPLRWQPADVSPWPSGTIAQLATVSRLDEGKGIQLLLQALAAAGPALPDWQLNIHGQGPHETPLREIAERSGLGDRVQFRGYVQDLRAIWSTNHLMISPALDDGVPMTIPEAMLCQRPVLATRVGGAEDWVVHGQSGFLCPARDAAALGVALRDALAVRSQWESIGHAGAESALRRYRADDYLQLIAP